MVRLAKCDATPPENCISLRKRLRHQVGVPVSLVSELLKASVACETLIGWCRWNILTLWLVYLSPTPCKFTKNLEKSLRVRLGSRNAWKKKDYFSIQNLHKQCPMPAQPDHITPIQSRPARSSCQSSQALSPKSRKLNEQRDIIKKLQSKQKGWKSHLKREQKAKRKLENELHNARDQLNSSSEKLQKAKDQLRSQNVIQAESRQIQQQNKILSSSLNRQKRDLEMALDGFSMVNDELNSVKKQKTTCTSKPPSRKAYKRIHKQKQRLSLKAAKLEAEWGVVSDKLDLLTRFIQSGDMTGEKITEICKCISKDINDNAKKAQLKQLVEALSSPISMKEKGSYKDNVALLTMLLQTLGVPANSVGKVQEACCQLLLNRDVKSTVSRSTAARMMRRGGILAEAQIGIAFAEHGHRGVRIGQDTTTRQGTEHVSTIFTFKDKDNKAKPLQSKIRQLPNHTAETQMEHINSILENTNELIQNLDLPLQQRSSVLYVIEFMGDHINGKLHRLLKQSHLEELENALDSGKLNEEQYNVLNELYLSACQVHSGAKMSRSFYEGFAAIQPANVAKEIGNYGLQGKAGRTYEALAGKLIEYASKQFSPDMANTSDFNHAGPYAGWCSNNGLPLHPIKYVNKNRHYRHEFESGKLISQSDAILKYFEEQRSQRDPNSYRGVPSLLRNADSVVYHGLQNDECQAQLAAADALGCCVLRPYLQMLKKENIDVITVGPKIQETYSFLVTTSAQHELATKMLHGERTLFNTQVKVKPVGVLHFSEAVLSRAAHYVQEACHHGAEGLKHISAEYFEGGHYHNPCASTINLLQGREAHSDANEGNLGQFSQQKRSEPHARLQTTSSKVAVRANHTVQEALKSKLLMTCVGKSRKLERLQTQKEGTIKQQVATLSELDRPRREAQKEEMQRKLANRAERRAVLQGTPIFTTEEVAGVSGTVKERQEKLKRQLHIWKELRGKGKEAQIGTFKEKEVDPLQGKTIQQLLAIIDENELHHEGARKKKDLISSIRNNDRVAILFPLVTKRVNVTGEESIQMLQSRLIYLINTYPDAPVEAGPVDELDDVESSDDDET